MTTMDKNPIGELMQNTMESVKNMLKVDTVVGDPIDRCWPVGCRPILCSLGFRIGIGGLSSENLHAAKALPLVHHAHLWRGCDGLALNVHPGR